MLATDGLWEVMSNAEVVSFVDSYRLASYEAMSAADALSWEAQQRWKAGGEQVGPGLSDTFQIVCQSYRLAVCVEVLNGT